MSPEVIAAIIGWISSLSVVGIQIYYRHRHEQRDKTDSFKTLIINSKGTIIQLAKFKFTVVEIISIVILPILVAFFSSRVVRYILSELYIRGYDVFSNQLWSKLFAIFFCIILFSVIAMIILWRSGKIVYRTISMFTFLLSIVILFSVVLTYFNNRSIMILIDRSIYFENYYETSINSINSAIEKLPINVKVGVGVFGISQKEEVTCNNYYELIGPTNDHGSLQNALKLASELYGSNNSPLHNTVLFSTERILQLKGMKQILIITSSLDRTCDRLERWQVDELKTDNNEPVWIEIISMGDINDFDKYVYELYADRYQHLDDPDNLTNTIRLFLSRPPDAYTSYLSVYQTYSH